MPTSIDTLDLVGGDLAFDLVNTASARRVGPFRDRLESYSDLVRWGERVGLLGEGRSAILLAEASERPDAARAAVESARELRETVYRIFAAVAAGDAPESADVTRLQVAAAEAAATREIVADEAGDFHFEWPDCRNLEQLNWPVAMSAAELLVGGERARIKECATDNCNWLFVDSSRNRSRRWCDMKDCGNRAKARRHYARTKG